MFVVCFCVRMCTCDGGALTDQKRALHFPQLESQVVVGHPVWCCEPNSGPLKERYALLTSELSSLHPDFKGKGNQEGVWWDCRSHVFTVTGSTRARQPSQEFLTFILSHNLPAEKKEGRRREEERTHGRARICTLPRKLLSITQELGLPAQLSSQAGFLRHNRKPGGGEGQNLQQPHFLPPARLRILLKRKKHTNLFSTNSL